MSLCVLSMLLACDRNESKDLQYRIVQKNFRHMMNF